MTMGQVPDQVQRWLYGVLLNEYRDAQRTYSDSIAALSAYTTLSPRTDVYTYNTGRPVLLLCLSGTIPVTFRGTVYRFPITIWLPHAYPTDPEGIMAYVVPGEGMVIRPGQHVSVDGRVYHPYLRDWAVRERSSLVEFLRILQDVFAREPPVIAKQQVQRPPPPPKERPPSVQPIEMPAARERAPPRPPKPGDSPVQRRQDGPPLPPLPHASQLRSGNSFSTPPTPVSAQQRYSAAPPLPHEIRQSPVSPLTPEAHQGTPGQRYSQPIPLPHQQPQQMPCRPAQNQFPHQHQHQHQHQQQQQQQYPQQPYQYMQPQMPAQPFHQQQTQPQPPPQKPRPALDLLTDPFDISIPTATPQTGPAPPIPPNPEKEHLLHLLSTSLVSQIHHKVSQNTAALAPLRAQSSALQDAHTRLNAELSQLQALDSTLASNENILHHSLHACDAVIENSKSTPAPPIDDVLVAPTVAATQLWNLQAEEAALKEALWCLQRAVGAGRVAPETFVRLTRGLARELFVKMALSRKLARGLGLDVGVMRRELQASAEDDFYGGGGGGY